MAYINIPDKQRDALMSLASLPNEALAKLIDDLEASDGKYGSLSQALGQHIDLGGDGLRALISLTVLSRDSEIPTPELIGYIQESFDVETSSDSLLQLVKSGAVQRAAKAMQLRNSYERILVHSQILSDIRPVFGDEDPCDRVDSAMVNHVLKLSYRTSDVETKDLYLAVDADDLQQLRGQVDRALKKESASKEFIEAASAVVLEVREPSE